MLVLLGMTFLPALTRPSVLGMGLLMGVATGLHWANRNYLSLVCTRDRMRNYYFGVESFFSCLGSVFVPAAAGAFISWWCRVDPSAAGTRAAYRWVGVAALALALGSAAFLANGVFPSERPAIRVRARYPVVWRRLLLLAVLKGTVHIFLMTSPAVLIIRVLGGHEGALGLVQSIGAVAAAAVMYGIGRVARPRHRVPVLVFALVLYGAGAVVNALLYDRLSVLLFIGVQLMAQPMLDLSYGPIMLGALDAVSAAGGDRESRYAYLVSHEIGIFAGRVLGACAFIVVACASTGDAAFRYVLALMALVHLLCWPVANAVCRELGWTSG